MFVLMLLVYKGFLPPLLSVLPQGQNQILPRGQKIFSSPLAAILPPMIYFLPPLKMFSAPAKINPAHATAYSYNSSNIATEQYLLLLITWFIIYICIFFFTLIHAFYYVAPSLSVSLLKEQEFDCISHN